MPPPVRRTLEGQLGDALARIELLENRQRSSGIPTRTGAIFQSPEDPGAGFVPCDGRALNRAAEANLFARIGTTYGTGDGATTFHVPNLNGKHFEIPFVAGVGTFSADNVFAQYGLSLNSNDQYTIMGQIDQPGNNGYMDFRMRSGGVDAAAANSYSMTRSWSNSSSSVFTVTSNTDNRLYVQTDAAAQIVFSMEITDAGRPDYTDIKIRYKGRGAQRTFGESNGEHQVSSAYDGFTLLFPYPIIGWVKVIPFGGSLVPSYIKL